MWLRKIISVALIAIASMSQGYALAQSQYSIEIEGATYRILSYDDLAYESGLFRGNYSFDRHVGERVYIAAGVATCSEIQHSDALDYFDLFSVDARRQGDLPAYFTDRVSGRSSRVAYQECLSFIQKSKTIVSIPLFGFFGEVRVPRLGPDVGKAVLFLDGFEFLYSDLERLKPLADDALSIIRLVSAARRLTR